MYAIDAASAGTDQTTGVSSFVVIVVAKYCKCMNSKCIPTFLWCSRMCSYYCASLEHLSGWCDAVAARRNNSSLTNTKSKTNLTKWKQWFATYLDK